MGENFITKIMIHDVTDIRGFQIPLSEDKRMHLIITGINGSGKTSLLLEISRYLERISSDNSEDFWHLGIWKNEKQPLEGFTVREISTLVQPQMLYTENLPPDYRIALPLDALHASYQAGRPRLLLSQIFQSAPYLFSRRLIPGEDQEVALPYQRVRRILEAAGLIPQARPLELSAFAPFPVHPSPASAPMPQAPTTPPLQHPQEPDPFGATRAEFAAALLPLPKPLQSAPTETCEGKVSMSLASVLRSFRPKDLGFDASNVPSNVMVDFPLSMVYAQLATGRVQVTISDIIDGLATKFHPAFAGAFPGLVITIPLTEILNALPGDGLGSVTTAVESPACFVTPFTKRAAEDAATIPLIPAPPAVAPNTTAPIFSPFDESNQAAIMPSVEMGDIDCLSSFVTAHEGLGTPKPASFLCNPPNNPPPLRETTVSDPIRTQAAGRRERVSQETRRATTTFRAVSELGSSFKTGSFILAFFGARRSIQMKEPKGIEKVTLKQNYKITDQADNEFIQYIVNQKADRSFAKDDNDSVTAEKIDAWFSTFEASLQSLFDCPELKLEFDRKNYNFNLTEPGKAPYNLNQLSDGYSAILSIVTDLIIRMEKHRVSSYDVQGVVLIDEIETHLHIDLQKKILPFLTAFFPRVQFIVSTHSPFVLNSIENAVICDLEKRIVTTDLSGYSYDTLIESYFDSDKYSDQLKTKVLRYETLATAKEPLSEAETAELRQLQRYLDVIPKFVSDELAVKLQQIKLQQLKRRS